MPAEVKVSELEVGDKVAIVTSSRGMGRESVHVRTVTKKLKTTITLDDVVFNVHRTSDTISGVRGEGPRGTWDVRPWYMSPDDPFVAEVRKRISHSNLRYKVQKVLDAWTKEPTAAMADEAAKHLTAYAEWVRAAGVES